MPLHKIKDFDPDYRPTRMLSMSNDITFKGDRTLNILYSSIARRDGVHPSFAFLLSS